MTRPALDLDQGAALDHGGRVEAAALTVGPSPALASWSAVLLPDDHPAPMPSRGRGVELVEDLDGVAVAGARPRTSAARPDSYCAHCGRRMSPGRHGRRVYCSNGCRQLAYKKRRRVERAAASRG